jgi:hypothetical protein
MHTHIDIWGWGMRGKEGKRERQRKRRAHLTENLENSAH